MGALEMIRDICKDQDGDCNDCPFVNSNMMTPDELKEWDGYVDMCCYFNEDPVLWDTDRIISTAEAAYKNKFGYYKERKEK